MSYTLTPPYKGTEREDFIVKYNHQQGLFIYENESGIYALEENEVLIDGKIQINPNYEKEIRLKQISIELENIKNELNELDIKSIRAIREGGITPDGISYIDFYQSKINELRQRHTDLVDEQSALENSGGADDITD